jgi:putative endopeptidase
MRVIFASMLLAGTALGGPAAVSSAQEAPAAKAATKPDFGAFGLDQTAIDRSVKPGDDFYDYVNGSWLAKTEIPADKTSAGVGNRLDDLLKERLRALLDTARKDPANMVGRAYASYLDTATVEARGMAPIQPWLTRIRSIKDRRDYSALAVEAATMGTGGPIAGFVWYDAKAPDVAVFTIVQGGIGLPDRDLYLSDNPALAKIRELYVAHLARMLTLAGETNVEARAKAVMAMETEIAKVHWTGVDSTNSTKIYNKYTLAQTAQFATPTVNLPAMLKATSPKITEVVIWQPSAVKGTSQIMDKAPLQVLKDQMILRSLRDFADVLPDAVANENFAFWGTALSGTPQRQPRWRRGVTYSETVAGDAIGKQYTDLYFPPEYKAEMNRLVANMVDAMGDRIEKVAWMRPETKVRAKAKLGNFIVKVGYPDRWRDYRGLEIKADDLFGNTIRAAKFNTDYNLDKLGKPYPRWEWIFPPQVINAYANFGMMEVVFAAGMLQPPFFDPRADPAINYGAIGAIAAHEITHHFDNRGAAYDEKGVLSDWWTPEDLKGFEAAGKTLIDQYDLYEPLPGQKIKGAFTLSENTGDLAGLAIAYDAYQKSLGGKPAPVIDGFTGDQRFFMGWAQAFRSKQREGVLRQMMLTDPHSPPKYRVLTVRNLDAWYKAFDVKPGDKLYLEPGKRAKVW